MIISAPERWEILRYTHIVAGCRSRNCVRLFFVLFFKALSVAKWLGQSRKPAAVDPSSH